MTKKCKLIFLFFLLDFNHMGSIKIFFLIFTFSIYIENICTSIKLIFKMFSSMLNIIILNSRKKTNCFKNMDFNLTQLIKLICKVRIILNLYLLIRSYHL